MPDRMTTAQRVRALARQVAELRAAVFRPRARDMACTCLTDGAPCRTCRGWERHRTEVGARVLSGKYR
jgi:hypothetical protein